MRVPVLRGRNLLILNPRGYDPPMKKLAKVVLVMSILSWVSMGLGIGGYRVGLLGLKPALGIVAGVSVLSFLLSLLSMVTLFGTRPGKSGFPQAVVATLLTWSIAIPMGIQFYRVRSFPKIHDISTDTEHPPLFNVLLTRREGAVNSAIYGGVAIGRIQHEAYPDIVPLDFAASADVAFDRALDVAKSLKWDIAAADKFAGRIEASVTSLFMAFTDDIVIRVEPKGPHESRVDIRSLSRVGLSDLGQNATRIRNYLSRFRGDH